MSPSLEGLVTAMLPPVDGEPIPFDTASAAATLDRFLGYLPGYASFGLRSAAVVLDGASLIRHGRRLLAIDETDREVLLRFIGRTHAGADILDALKATVCLAGGADRYADEMLARGTRLDPARPDAMLDVTDGPQWPTTSRCDVVVIGTGAGGAMAARTIASSGASVVLVEEGRRWTVDEFRTQHPADRFGALYRDGGATIAVGRPFVALPIGKGVGGTTLVNSGTCYRTPLPVMRRWTDELGVGAADPATFSARLDDVEALLQIAPAPLEVIGNNALRTLDAAARLGWKAAPLRRNAPGCAGSCQCAIGCPRNAKFGVHLNALPEACASGARIASGLRVRAVLHDRGRATGVEARRADGSVVTITASRVVVAAGATETPPLLRRSGLGRHPDLGRNLALHPALSAAGRFEEDITPWHGVLQSAGVEEFHDDEGILIEATATPPGMGSMALPGHGRRLAEHVANAHHLVTLGAMIGDDPSGRVSGRRDGMTVIRYDLSKRDGPRLLRALELMGELLFAGGAIEVHTGIRGHDVVHGVAELRDAVAAADIRHMHLAAFHPTGTARMGADPTTSPTATDGSLRGINGVYVADASIIPTCPEVNPQVTIMAMASHVADEVLASIG